MNQTSESHQEHPSPYGVIAAQIVMIVAIVTTNTLTLVAIETTSRLQTISNTYIASLATADLLVFVNKAIGIFWVHPKFHYIFEENRSLCLFFKCLIQITELASLTTIVLIAVDRFLYIKFPFYYLRVVTKTKVKVVLLFAWLVSIGFTVLVRVVIDANGYPGCGVHALLFESDLTGYVHGALFLLICLALCVLYGFVLRTASRQAKAIKSSHTVGLIAETQSATLTSTGETISPSTTLTSPTPASASATADTASPTVNHATTPSTTMTPTLSPTSAASPTTTLTPTTCNSTSSTDRKGGNGGLQKARLSLRAVKLMAGVFLMLFVCWAPYAVIGLIGPMRVSASLVLLAAFLAAFNSAANFVVYALGDRVFRAAIGRLLGCRSKTPAGILTDVTPASGESGRH